MVKALLARVPTLKLAVSATTRDRRPGEEDGREYWFLSDEEFQRRIDADDFLEWVDYVGQPLRDTDLGDRPDQRPRARARARARAPGLAQGA